MSTHKITIPSPTPDYLSQTATHLSTSFECDPVMTFMLNAHPRPKRLALLPGYFHVLIKAAILNQAIITEMDDWSTCAVWMPPGKSADNWATNFQAGFLKAFWDVGMAGVYHTLVDYSIRTDKIKNRELKKYNDKGGYYYCFFIGTLPESQGQGLGTELMKHWMERASVEGIPVYLEATTSGSHQLYLKLGFVDLEALRLGVGKAAPDGTYQKGGEGVPIWAMIWDPAEHKKVHSTDTENGEPKG